MEIRRSPGQDWDQELPKPLSEPFADWCSEVNISKKLALKRCYFYPGTVEMHIYGDASLDVFGAVVFLKTANPHGFIELVFVLCKARVAPMKSWTIRRKLELQAAVLATHSKVLKAKILS